MKTGYFSACVIDYFYDDKYYAISSSTLNQLKKPMEVGRCACITAQLQLEDCSPQECQILAAAQEKLA